MIGTTTQAALVPGVDYFECQWGMNGNGRVKASGGLPRPVSNSGYVFSLHICFVKRHNLFVANDQETGIVHAINFHLETFQRGIHITRRPSDRALLTQHMPGLECMPDFHGYSSLSDRAVIRKAKLQMRLEPIQMYVASIFSQMFDHFLEIFSDEVWKQKSIMQFCSPADERLLIGLLPEKRNQGAQHQ